jgi:hypothetical protein
MSNNKGDIELSNDEALLDQLKREEQQVESRGHNGFSDAGLRNRLEGQIDELDQEIFRIKERAVEGER